MRTRALLMFSLLAAGCFNPDDIFPIHGQVVSANGVEGLTVEMLRAESADFSGACDGEFRAFKTTTTDADGAFLFEVFRAQTQSLSQQGLFCFKVRVTFASGTVAETDLIGIANETQLATFFDWVPDARLENGLLSLTPVYDVNSVDGGTLTQRADFESSDGGLFWEVDDVYFDTFTMEPVTRPMEFSELHAEDFTGELSFSAVAGQRMGSGTSPFDGLTFNAVRLTASQKIPVVGTRTALSRGAACGSLGTPCPLTDGVAEPFDLGSRMSVSIELPTPQRVQSVVFRELEVGAPIIVAQFFDADGGLAATQQGTFDYSQRALSSLPRRRRDAGMLLVGSTPAWVTVAVDGGVTAKKVTFQFPGGVNACSEVSLF
ncbi:MAG: hypothetical protein QM817_31475 [Archangium sp.]